MRIPIATGSSQGRSIPLTAERLVNMYAEKAPSGARSQVVVHGCPGLTRFCDIDTRRTRGLYRTAADGRLYTVIRNSLYYVSPEGVATNLGTIAGSGRVGISDNGLQLCIVAGATGYTYSVTDGLQEITDSGFPGADTVTFLDGYFIFNNSTPGSRGQFFISELLDGQIYDATDFATAESYPDNLVRVFADHSQLLLFGSETIEIWFNAGLADFPFTRAQGSVIEQGLGARWSVSKLDETVVWLDNEGMVRRLEGNTPVRISTHAIEYEITRGDWNNATAWSYVEEGHQFYVLTVPAADLATQKSGTYVYDAATQLWHERKSYRQDYSRSGFYAYAYGKHITADIDIGRLYEQSLDVYEEDGEHLIAEMQFPQVQNDGKRFIVDRLQLDMEVGALRNQTRTVEYIDIEQSPPEYVASLNTTAFAPGNSSFSLTGIHFKPDGTEAYLSTNQFEDRIVQLSLSTPWDITTATLTSSFINNAQEQVTTGISLSGDGLKLYTCGFNNDRVYQYALSIPWDLSTISYTGIFEPTIGSLNVFDMYFRDDGLEYYLLFGSDVSVQTFGLTIPWDLSTAAHVRTSILTGVPNGGSAFTFTDDGNSLIYSREEFIYLFELSTAWDTSTAVYSGQSANLGLVADNTDAMFLSLSAMKLYTSAKYTLSSSTAINEFDFNYVTNQEAIVLPEPFVMLDESGNTRTFDMNQNWRSMGKKGEYDKRVIWRRRGQHRSYTPRVAISAPVKRAIFAAYVDIRPCKS